MVSCEQLRDAIEPHLRPAQMIVLDLSEVIFIDSSSLHVLVHARGRLTADGGSVVLRNPSVAARRVLTAAQTQGLLDVEEESRAADPKLRIRQREWVVRQPPRADRPVSPAVPSGLSPATATRAPRLPHHHRGPRADPAGTGAHPQSTHVALATAAERTCVQARL